MELILLPQMMKPHLKLPSQIIPHNQSDVIISLMWNNTSIYVTHYTNTHKKHLKFPYKRYLCFLFSSLDFLIYRQ